MDDDAPARDRAAAEAATGEIEGLLERQIGLRGDSLPAMLAAAGKAIPDQIAAKIRLVEACRQELNLHADTVLADREAFDRAVREVVAFLKSAPTPARRAPAAPMRRRRRPVSPVRAVAVGMLIIALALLAVAVWGIVGSA